MAPRRVLRRAHGLSLSPASSLLEEERDDGRCCGTRLTVLSGNIDDMMPHLCNSSIGAADAGVHADAAADAATDG